MPAASFTHNGNRQTGGGDEYDLEDATFAYLGGIDVKLVTLIRLYGAKDYPGMLLLLLQAWKGTAKGQAVFDKLMQDASGPLGL